MCYFRVAPKENAFLIALLSDSDSLYNAFLWWHPTGKVGWLHSAWFYPRKTPHASSSNYIRLPLTTERKKATTLIKVTHLYIAF